MKVTMELDIKKARMWLALNTHKNAYNMTPEQVKFAIAYSLYDMGVSLIETEVVEKKLSCAELCKLIGEE